MSTMRWLVLAPFAHGTQRGWIVAEAHAPGHRFEVVPAGYHHDRSRPVTGAKAWLDYVGHALRAWRSAGPGDGFVTWFPQLAVCLGLVKRLTGSRRPVIAWCFNLGDIRQGWRGRLARFALRDVDVFVVHARRERTAYAAWLGVAPERFVFRPLAVAEPQAALDLDPPDSGPPISMDEPFILAMGSARRDYALFIQVMTALGLPTVIVCGPHAVAGLDIPPNVTVVSGLTIEACHDLARRARVNVAPIANDATASGQVTVIEAMMLGKAVVATRCTGTEDYITDGADGVLVAPGDGEALSGAITRLWGDGPLREALGQAARRTALDRFSFPAGGPALAALVEMTAGPAKPSGESLLRPRQQDAER